MIKPYIKVYFNMQILNFISFVYKNETKDSENQYETLHPSKFYEGQEDLLKTELSNFYSDNLFTTEKLRSEKYAFLDYHLSCYKGDNRDFFDFVYDSIDLVVHEDLQFYYPVFFMNKDRYAKVLRDWCDERRYLMGSGQGSNKTKNKIQGSEDNDLGNLGKRIKVMRDMIMVSKEEIENFFRKAFILDNPIMTEEQLKQFLWANFEGFPEAEVKKMDLECEQKDVMAPVYEFYKYVHTDLHRTSAYCNMLINNFDKIFDDYILPDGTNNTEGLGGNFSRHYLKRKGGGGS